MKKGLIILLILVGITLTGCGSKSNANDSKTTEESKAEITLKLGKSTETFKGESITCGDKKIQSNIIFTAEKGENGKYKGSYEFYECNEGNVNLETSTGYFDQDDEIITFVNSYEQTLTFELTDDNTIVQKNGSKDVRTFTK